MHSQQGLSKIIVILTLLVVLIAGASIYLLLTNQKDKQNNNVTIPEGSEYVPDEAIIRVTDETLTENDLRQNLAHYQVIEVEKVSGNLEGLYLIKFEQGVNLEQRMSKITARPYVDSAEPNFISEINEY